MALPSSHLDDSGESVLANDGVLDTTANGADDSTDGLWWGDVIEQAASTDDEESLGEISSESENLDAVAEAVSAELSPEDELLADLADALHSDEPHILPLPKKQNGHHFTSQVVERVSQSPANEEVTAEVRINDSVAEDLRQAESVEDLGDISAEIADVISNTEVAESGASVTPASRNEFGFGTPAPIGPLSAAGVPPQNIPTPQVSPFFIPYNSPPPQPTEPALTPIEVADNNVRSQLLALLSGPGLPALRNVDVYVERGMISIRAVVAAPGLQPSRQLPPVQNPVAGPVTPYPGLAPLGQHPVAPTGWQAPAVPQWLPQPTWAPPPAYPPGWQGAAIVSIPVPVVQSVAESLASSVVPSIPDLAPHLPDPALYERKESGGAVLAVNLDSGGGLDDAPESDESVHDRLIASLVATNIPSLAALEVTVEGGVITLEGFVTSNYERQVVLDMVQRECDAWHVRNVIRVIVPKGPRFSIVEYVKELWLIYRIEMSVIGFLVAAMLLFVVPWPEWAPAATYKASVDALLEKEPMTGAVIALHPDNWKLPNDAIPTGRVDADGKVVFSTFADRDGIPAGEYIVTARWNKLVSTPGGDAVMGPNVVPAIYGSPDTSPVKIKIDSSTKELPALVFARK